MNHVKAVMLMSILLGASGHAAEEGALSRTAILAGGCFWCMERPYEELNGVTEVVSGYAGGHVKNPTYEQVSAGDTGHREVVQVTYDPARVSYQE